MRKSTITYYLFIIIKSSFLKKKTLLPASHFNAEFSFYNTKLKFLNETDYLKLHFLKFLEKFDEKSLQLATLKTRLTKR